MVNSHPHPQAIGTYAGCFAAENMCSGYPLGVPHPLFRYVIFYMLNIVSSQVVGTSAGCFAADGMCSVDLAACLTI